MKYYIDCWCEVFSPKHSTKNLITGYLMDTSPNMFYGKFHTLFAIQTALINKHWVYIKTNGAWRRIYSTNSLNVAKCPECIS